MHKVLLSDLIALLHDIYRDVRPEWVFYDRLEGEFYYTQYPHVYTVLRFTAEDDKSHPRYILLGDL